MGAATQVAMQVTASAKGEFPVTQANREIFDMKRRYSNLSPDHIPFRQENELLRRKFALHSGSHFEPLLVL